MTTASCSISRSGSAGASVRELGARLRDTERLRSRTLRLMSNLGETVNGTPLHRVCIVLVEPTHPGNVGAAARAMKAMGLDRLCLVAPRRFPSAEATARAAGADDVLHAARIVGSLDEALADCGFVLGTTARSRRIEWPVFDAREGARRAVAQAARTPVAVVFGRESAGLTNAELDRCHALVRISTAAHFSSLNVAAAVQILVYEMRIAAYGGDAGAHGKGTEARREVAGAHHESAGECPSPPSPPATTGELEGFLPAPRSDAGRDRLSRSGRSEVPDAPAAPAVQPFRSGSDGDRHPAGDPDRGCPPRAQRFGLPAAWAGRRRERRRLGVSPDRRSIGEEPRSCAAHPAPRIARGLSPMAARAVAPRREIGRVARRGKRGRRRVRCVPARTSVSRAAG